MDKNAIKKYAIWARRELISRVSQKAAQYAITDGDIADANAETVNGIVLTNTEKTQRRNLIAKIREKGYEQVMEEIAYTWFNRFCALRFMEVNNYLPSHIRVFTNEDNEFRPQIIDEAIHLELEGLNMQTVYAFKEANDNEGLYKYLIITQCNSLGKILPGMFEHISDYTELLFPDNILREGSVIEQMITLIPQEDWQDAVQIIGWLYQYYNTEPKDKVFADLKKNIKISKENIPAATQLFTPDWIVRYMVENSVGRWYYDGMQGWLQDSPDVNRLETLKSNWKYYIDEAEQTEEVQAELEKLRSEKCPDLDSFKVIDTCMGSGHILVYAFDVLMQIYLSCGFSERDAVKNIVEKNLYGLDIDDRAAQLAYFAVMMKARQYDRRFLTRGIRPNVYAIIDSELVGGSYKLEMGNFLLSKEHQKTLNYILDIFKDAKEYGSIIQLEDRDYIGLRDAWKNIAAATTENFNLTLWYSAVEKAIPPLIEQAIILSQKYDVVCTNPPYMGASGMSNKLTEFVKNYYPNSKSDFSTIFMEKTMDMCKNYGYMSMINIPVWMFLSSYQNLREQLLCENTIINLVHPGRGIFGSDFGTTSFVISKKHIAGYYGTYRRLFDKQGEVESIESREKAFFSNKGYYLTPQENYFIIPGTPIAYWLSKKYIRVFESPTLDKFSTIKVGLQTGDNNRFLRLWHECNYMDIFFDCTSHSQSEESQKVWYPYNKGGEYRKWFGNNDYVVNWHNDGYLIKNFIGDNGKLRSRPQNTDFYFKKSITYSYITSGVFNARIKDTGFIFDVNGASIFPNEHYYKYILGLLCSCLADGLTKVINPTISLQSGDIAKIPLKFDSEKNQIISSLVEENIALAKMDWDSFETSWDFTEHPLVRLCHGVENETGNEQAFIEDAFIEWQSDCNRQFNQLKSNEEELNRIFIDIYGLQDELTPEVEDKDVTVHYIADTKEDAPESMRSSNYLLTKQDVIKSFISYAVGCMLGRYSLDIEGLAFAGGEWDSSKYKTYMPDDDNCIPITDEEYFKDDIVGRFCEFVKAVYGEETLEENLDFIASALGNKGNTSRSVIRNYFLNDFYADHCKIYQKRPIYWLFDSGKKNGFKALIYMHRYREDTLARMRTDYVHEQQSRYRTAIEEAERQASSAKDSERVKISKTLNKLKEQDEELRVYEEKIHHLADQMIRIDLDDGVKHNYDLFKDVLAKIK